MVSKLRLKEKNALLSLNKQAKIYNQIDNNTIARLRTSTDNIDFNYIQISKLKEKIKTRESNIQQNNNRLILLENGELDLELTQNIKKINDELHLKNKEAFKRKLIDIEKKKAQKQKTIQFYKDRRMENKEKKDIRRDLKYGEKHFNRTCNNIPDYILRKLRNMPNNKGYIWKSVFLYGDKKAELNKPVAMFEKKKGVLIIHEWTDQYYKVYSKKGQDRKQLVSSTKRKKKKLGID